MNGGDRQLAAVAAGSAAVAAVAVLVATRHGPGLSPDSAAYLSAGLNLAGGRGIESFRGDPVTAFPPGLSVVVAVGHGLGLGVGWTVRLFNAATVAGMVVLAHLLLRRHVRDRLLVALATVLIALSTPVLFVAQMAWSELAFLTICLAMVLVLERVLVAPRAWRWLVCAAGLAALGFLFRYAGVTLIALGLVTVAAATWRLGWRRAGAAMTAYVLAAGILPVAWMLRNRAADGTLMGPRFPSSDGGVVTIKRFVTTVGGWAAPDPIPRSLDGPVGLLVLLLLVAGSALVLRSRWSTPDDSVPPASGAASPTGSAASLLPLVAFVVIYAGYVIAAQLATAIDPIDTRLLSPLYVPLVILGAIVLDAVAVEGRVGRVAVPRLAVALALAAIVVQGQLFVRTARASAVHGNGYATPAWQSSALAATVGRLPADVDIYSNGSDALWAVLQRQPLLQSPAKGLPRSDVRQDLPPEFLVDVGCQPSYLAWFDTIDRPYLFAPDELRNYVRLRRVSADADGTLYRIEPKAPPRTPC